MKIAFPFFSKFFRPAEKQTEDQDLVLIRKRVSEGILLVTCIMGTLAHFSAVFGYIQNRDWLMLSVTTIAYGSILTISTMRKLNYQYRAWAILGLFFMMGASDLFSAGLTGEGRLFLTVMVVLSLVLLELRAGIVMFILATLTVTLAAALMITGIIPLPAPSAIDDSSKLGDWLTGGFVFIMATGLAVSAMNSVINGLNKSLTRQRQLSDEVRNERNLMEQRVTDRTRELEQQAHRLEIISQFARDLSRLNSKQTIFTHTCDYIDQKLSFTNLLIWTADEKNDVYTAEKVSGELANSVIPVQSRMKANLPGSISEVMAGNEPRLLRNNAEEARYFKTSGLENVPVMLVVPFHIDQETNGAILLLLEKDASFFSEDFEVFHSMADQLGISLQKARLTLKLEENLEELKTSSKQMTQQSWRSYLRASRRTFAMKYSHGQVLHGAPQSSEASQALKVGTMVIENVTPAEDGKPFTSVAVPILLRGQPLGVINLRFESQTVPEDMLTLVEAVTKRLAVSLENARLMEEMKQRAEREHTVSNISTKVRATSDIDGILKVAAQEIGRSLGVAEVLVQLRPEK